MNSGAGLDAGLFVGGEHKVICGQRLVLPYPRVEIQHPSGLAGKVRIARKNPAAVLPRTNGILVQPAPNRAATDAGDQACSAGVAGPLRRAPTGQWLLRGGGPITRPGFYVHPRPWG